jgi:murein DD-endopeptidase MepM/ murein hydrolase activator NlpD
MPTTGVFTSGFGYRTDPLGRGRRFHSGQDIGAPMGTPIVAATAGTIAYAGWESGYGNYTCIDRGSGFATCYGHQSRILVTVGQQVQQGQQIGLVGSTGNSTGPHLHFEVRLNGVPVDPVPYLP